MTCIVIGPDHTRKKKIVVMVAVVSAACGMLVLSFLCWWIIWKRAKRTSKHIKPTLLKFSKATLSDIRV